METKEKSENQKANMEMVLESISEDLRANADTTTRFVSSIEKLNYKIDILIENKKESDKTNEVLLKEIKQGNSQLSGIIGQLSFPEEKMRQVSDIMQRFGLQLRQPIESKITHHHHISKGIWVAASLFILLALESAGWLNTHNKLDQFIENDTKYRFIRLDTAAKSLESYLDSADALYKSNPEMRSQVLNLEKKYRQNIDRLEKADRLKQEARELENKVHAKE